MFFLPSYVTNCSVFYAVLAIFQPYNGRIYFVKLVGFGSVVSLKRPPWWLSGRVFDSHPVRSGLEPLSGQT